MIAKIKHGFAHLFVTFICAITPRCHEMTRLISREREQPHHVLTRVRMAWHYGICVWCLRYRDHLALLGKISRSFPEHSCGDCKNLLTEEAKIRIAEAITHEADA